MHWYSRENMGPMGRIIRLNNQPRPDMDVNIKANEFEKNVRENVKSHSLFHELATFSSDTENITSASK